MNINDERYLQYCAKLKRQEKLSHLKDVLGNRISSIEGLVFSVWVEEIESCLPHPSEMAWKARPARTALHAKIPNHIPLRKWWRQGITPTIAVQWIQWHQKHLRKIAMISLDLH